MLVVARGDCSKSSSSGDGLRPRSVSCKATVGSATRVASGTATGSGCAVAVSGLVAEDLLIACDGTFFVIHIGSRFFTGASIVFSFDIGGDISCGGCLAGFIGELPWTFGKAASVTWAILNGMAVSGGDDNGSGSSNSGPHITEDTARRSCFEGESAFSASF